MSLYILAIIICLASIAQLILELKSEGIAVIRTPRFWVGLVSFCAAFIFVMVANNQQQRESTQNALTAQRQTSEMEKVRSSQEAQRTNSDQIIDSQKAQLEALKNQAEAQEQQIKLQNEQKEITGRLIESQQGQIQLLNRVNLNHNLSGIELSFKPSAERWARIAAAYSKTRPPDGNVPYIAAAMVAEKEGRHWKIEFEPHDAEGWELKDPARTVKPGGGSMLFPRVFTDTDDSKAFEEVIREASLGLMIEWGNGSKTALEPWRYDYPSAIRVSRESISLILHPPLIIWNLNDLRQNPTIRFAGRDYPIALPPVFRIRSRDPGVIFDQTFQMNWKKGHVEGFYGKLNRQVSDPCRLHVTFKYTDRSIR